MILPINKAYYHDLNSLGILKTLVMRRIEKYLDLVRSLNASFFFKNMAETNNLLLAYASEKIYLTSYLRVHNKVVR